MHHLSRHAILSLLVACGAPSTTKRGPDTIDEAEDDGENEAGIPCDIRGPSDGDHGFGPLRFGSPGEHPSPEITVRGPEGPVSGTWTTVATGSGWEHRFAPDEPLRPSTAHSWSAAAGCSDEGTFTTSDAGTPVASPEAFEGQTFPGTFCDVPEDCNWDIGSAAAPALLSGLMYRPPFVVRIDDIDAASGRVDLTLGGAEGGRGEPGSQDACSHSVRHTGEWAADSYVIVRGERLSWAFAPIIGNSAINITSLPGTVGVVWDWELVLSLEEDPARISPVALSGTFDWREHLGALMGGGSEPGWEIESLEELCSVAAMSAAACEPCPDGVEACWTGSIPGIASPQIADLIDISVDQTENHLCEDRCDNALDDDGDGALDADEPECDAGAWPAE